MPGHIKPSPQRCVEGVAEASPGRTASQKAADYSQFRNAIVHGPVLFDNWADSKTHQQFLILQPKLPNAKSLKLAIPISKVHSGAECFRQLSKAMFECLNFYLDRQNIPRPIGEALSPAKFAQLVEKLPTLQHSKGHNRPKRAKRQLRGTP